MNQKYLNHTIVSPFVADLKYLAITEEDKWAFLISLASTDIPHRNVKYLVTPLTEERKRFIITQGRRLGVACGSFLQDKTKMMVTPPVEEEGAYIPIIEEKHTPIM